MQLTIAQLAAALGAESWGDTGATITGVAEPASAGEGELALAMAPKYAEALKSGAIAMLAPGMDPSVYGLRAAVFAPRPRLAMAGLTKAFDAGPDIAAGIHPSAVIDPSVQIGEGAAIGPFVVIGKHVRIGANVRIAAGVTIGNNTTIGDDAVILQKAHIAHGVEIGDRFILHPGAIIGSDGFSFVTEVASGVEQVRSNPGQREENNAPEADRHWHRIHSLGSVRIGHDVEIGANTTVDRGTVRATSIGDGTKLDNLVQLGHNVVVGRDCLICGQVGVAGSTRIGDRVVLGGQCGVSDNIFIGDDVIAGGGTNIYTNVPAGRVVLGAAGLKMETELEARRNIRRLPRLFAQVAELRETLARLTQKG